jgi:glucosamine--fructose-6-phosphate aminotransferase (isomerizing)
VHIFIFDGGLAGLKKEGVPVARGEVTFAEIQSQPQVWAEALNQFGQQADAVTRLWADGAFQQVIFTGCGSTYYLGVIGATQLQAATGTPARAVSASELMLFPQAAFNPQVRTLLVCVSRSGVTRETVEATRLFRQHGSGSILVVTCDSASPLAAAADLLIPIDAAQEQSRVQTRSFSSMAVVVTALAALLGGQDWRALNALPAALERLLAASEPLTRAIGEDLSITQFAFLGSGPQYGLACEAMLKFTEMSRVFSVGYHILEYLHGPRYAADSNTVIFGLVSDSAYSEEVRALDSLVQRGLRVVTLADSDRGEGLDALGDGVTLASGVPEWGRAILYLPPLQLVGWRQAVGRGFDPDNLPFDPRQQAT